MVIWERLSEKLGVDQVINSNINKFFEMSYKKDIKDKNKYSGFPSSTTKSLNKLSKRTGISFVDPKKSDYTFAPVFNHVLKRVGIKGGLVEEFLDWFNMKVWGGMSDYGRMMVQKNLMESYLEYDSVYENVTIIENLIQQEHPYYIKKILHEYKVRAVEEGQGFNKFILNNENYFKEIAVFFKIEDSTIVKSAEFSLEELENLTKSSLRDKLIKGTVMFTIVDMIGLFLLMGTYLIPEILREMGGSIGDFSPVIQHVYSVSNFLVNRWYVTIVATLVGWMLFKSRTASIAIDYLKLKIPGIKEYTINNEIVKFLKTYRNLMEDASPRDTFTYAYSRLDNEYLKYVFGRYINNSKDDLSNKAKPLTEILTEIPYIGKDYLDLIVRASTAGDPIKGFDRAIDLIEPRIEKFSKSTTKYIIITVVGISTLITLFLVAQMYFDVTVISDMGDQQFIDGLRGR